MKRKKTPCANALSLIRFAFPSMVMMLFMGLYTIVDTIFVARFVDTNALSSINIVCPVINLIVGLGTMLATGGSAVVAKKMGNGNTGEARSNFTLIVVAGAVIGLLITAAGLLFLDEIIWGLGASEILFHIGFSMGTAPVVSYNICIFVFPVWRRKYCKGIYGEQQECF